MEVITLGKKKKYTKRSDKKKVEQQIKTTQSKQASKTSKDKKQKAHELIENQMAWAKQNKFSLSSKKQANKRQNLNNTYSDYTKKVKTLINKYFEKHRIDDIRLIEEDKMNQLILDNYSDKSAFTIKAYTAAINLFQKSTQSEKLQGGGAFSEPLKLANVEKLRTHYEENDIVRYSSDSKTGHLTDETLNQLQTALVTSDKAHAKTAAEYLELSSHLATRFDGAIGLKGKHIVINEDNTATAYVVEKGRKPRWIHVRDEESVSYLKEKKESLSSQNHYIVNPPRITQGKNAGNRMKADVIEKQLGKVVNAVVKEHGISDGDKNISMHSARKYRAQEWAKEYAAMSPEQLESMILDRIIESERRAKEIAAENQKVREEIRKIKNNKGDKRRIQQLKASLREENLPSVASKYQTAIDRVNYRRLPGSKGPEDKGLRRTKQDRPLNHKELAMFLVSLDTGHYRVDVISQYYVKWDEIKNLKSTWKG